MSSQRPIVLIGANGQVGRAVRALLPHDWPAIALYRSDLNLESSAAVRRLIRQRCPSVVINAAAYTAVDRAEGDRERCFAVNAEAPAVLAVATRECDALLVHYSTDYVFDGAKGVPYVETDSVAPLNVYGESKAAGDESIRAAEGHYLILRTSWVYSASGSNFMQAVLRRAHERTELRVVNDRTGIPTAASFVAGVTVNLIRRELDSRDLGPRGLYNVAASGSATWFDFAEEILALDPARASQTIERVIPVSSEEFGGAAVRPPYSVLDCSKLDTAFGISSPPWRDQLRATFNPTPANSDD